MGLLTVGCSTVGMIVVEFEIEKIRVWHAGAMLREETEDLPRATQCACPSDVNLAIVRRFGLSPVSNT